ncbi:metal-dependent transcriptional regulator [Vagococcus entomophilus]|uniref:Manganese transport regulator n=1 Tax=Vagococcus entomophilus TaxID=1160095 RepID=A0A430AI97_9ENTE|nr:metal-dependent transcriptional regulator [Vagococcus entomophilus]RSU07842.1 Cro/Cl family transcriptional regulator [Vagococcus entomophilus]
MTPNKEDYLKLIFELGGDKNKINNKQIVSGLQVSAASVSEMISKLEKGGFVKHSPYQGVQLTKAGLQQASSLVRKHRLWEVFLVEHLGYSWNTVHEEAEVLEHVTSEELTSRLETYLNTPEFCPHGGVIPRKNQPIFERTLQTLADYPENTKVRIERVLDEKELLDYLVSIELNIHDIVTIEHISVYEGPITLKKSDQKSLHVSFKAANNIFVTPIV